MSGLGGFGGFVEVGGNGVVYVEVGLVFGVEFVVDVVGRGLDPVTDVSSGPFLTVGVHWGAGWGAGLASAEGGGGAAFFYGFVLVFEELAEVGGSFLAAGGGLEVFGEVGEGAEGFELFGDAGGRQKSVEVFEGEFERGDDFGERSVFGEGGEDFGLEGGRGGRTQGLQSLGSGGVGDGAGFGGGGARRWLVEMGGFGDHSGERYNEGGGDQGWGAE